MKKISEPQAASKRIRIAENERIHVGIDTHKHTYHVGLWSRTDNRLVTTWVQPSHPGAVIDALRECQAQIESVIYEAGPTGFSLARRLKEASYPAGVISAAHTPQAPGQKAKSDRLDCRKLAEYSAKGLLHPVYVPTEEEEADRQVMRVRDQIKSNRVRTMQQIKSFLLQHGIAEPHGLAHWSKESVKQLRALELTAQLRFSLDMLLDELDHATSQLKRATAAVTQLASQARHAKAVEMGRTVPGVGVLTAMRHRTELPKAERFDTSRQVGKILGLSPEVRSSGDTRHECGRERGGNRRLRSDLVEAAWRWIGRDPWAREQYQKRLAQTGNAKKAITAMARKEGIVLWRVMTRLEPYRPGKVQGKAGGRSGDKKNRNRKPLLKKETNKFAKAA
jgi:transposase